MMAVNCLTIGLSHTLDLVLLLDSIGVGGTLGSVHKLLSKALGNGLDVTEGRIAGTSGKQVDGRVHATQGRDIDGLATDNTGRTDAARIFTWTRVDIFFNKKISTILRETSKETSYI